MSSDKGIISMFDRLDEHIEKCEDDMSKRNYDLASYHAKEAMTSFVSPLILKMPKLHSANPKEAQNRLKEKIEKEYVVNEAERYLKRARDDLSNESARMIRIERKREVNNLESTVEWLKVLFESLKRL